MRVQPIKRVWGKSSNKPTTKYYKLKKDKCLTHNCNYEVKDGFIYCSWCIDKYKPALSKKCCKCSKPINHTYKYCFSCLQNLLKSKNK